MNDEEIDVRSNHHQEEFHGRFGNGAIVCSCGFATTHTLINSGSAALAWEFFERMHAAHIERANKSEKLITELQKAVLAYKRRHESGGPLSEVRPDSCVCSACDQARDALEGATK